MGDDRTAARTGSASRLFGVDALRGVLVLLMALDHTNHFVAQQHSTGEYWGGTFPVYHDPVTFVTRLVTHPVAPGFSLLLGVGMALLAHSRRERGWSWGRVLRHFWIRGAVLIALQLLVVNRAWELSPGGWGAGSYFGVLVALGGGMILGSLLLWLKPLVLLLVAGALLVGAEAIVPGLEAWGTGTPVLVSVLALPAGGQGWWVNYPILQWLELVVFGLAIGKWLAEDLGTALRRAAILGAALLLAFVPIRLLDGFGNIRPRAGDGWIDWLNTVKYPPSITFTLMTTGVNLLLLSLLGWAGARWASVRTALRPLATLGRAPLFFYVTHLFFYAAMGRMLYPEGCSIPAMLPVWALGVLFLYPFCTWYAECKRRQSPSSVLRYL